MLQQQAATALAPATLLSGASGSAAGQEEGATLLALAGPAAVPLPR